MLAREIPAAFPLVLGFVFAARLLSLKPRAFRHPHVPSRRPSQSKNRTPPRRLLLGSAAAMGEAATMPTRWLNNLIAPFFLPVAWIFTQALFTSFAQAATQHAFWATEEFWFFALGAVLWMLAFCGSIWVFGEPRPLRVYVLGHELTHAIWARAMGGKIFGFRASREGGYVLTDKTNFWIALAPYFHPLYSIVVIALYGGVSVFYDLRPLTPFLFGLLGLTWAFHLSFTLWMIPKGQSDLKYHGTIFSLVIIYVMNLLLLLALLIIAAPEVKLSTFTHALLSNAQAMSELLWELLVRLGSRLFGLVRDW